MNNQISFDIIYKKLKYSNAELKKIEDAYLFALEQHKDKTRLTGEEYIIHPLSVADILTTLNVDSTTIIASLLHETLNNGKNATPDILREKFGDEIAKIVECISKINKLEVTDETESSAIYLRKILVGLSEDPRVLYIKLADRLHNMRTIHAVRPSKQKAKANETMSVLIPIAHRLGINTIKGELEDICLKILKPEVYNDILEKLNKSEKELNDNLSLMKMNLSKLLEKDNVTHKIKGRVKSVHSIYKKLSKGKKWKDIYDILALRIFVNSVDECYNVINIIHAKYEPVPKRFKDYIARPKANMYQSLHTTIVGENKEVYEIQVRTYEMDEIAEKGIASHWSYKEKGTKKVQFIMEQKLEMFRNVIETNKELSDIQFENNVASDILEELIYVFTPKGDVIELPKGATPLDFAYRIHSRVGDTTVGAIVNDNIVTLSHELSNNDVIKIITNSNATPNQDWINIVKTPQAKSKIKSFFSKKDKDEYIEKGKDILEKEIRKRKLSITETLSDDKINKILNDLKLDSLEELYLSIGTLRYTAGYIINLTNDIKQNVDDILIEKIKNTTNNIKNQNDIIIDNYNDIMYNLAKCCMPVKGDEIIGYITKGEGITIHKKCCANIKDLKERLINVNWNDNVEGSYLSRITLLVNENNYLSDLITVSTKEKITITEIKNKDTEQGTICNITIKVKNKSELETFKNKLSKFKNIKVME